MKYINLTILALLVSLCSYGLIGPINGAGGICQGTTTTLTDTTAGGTWTSSNPSVATIGSVSGLTTGVSAGTATITYTTGSGFVTATVTVQAVPAVFTFFYGGSGGICTSGPGTHLYLSGSETGVTYKLRIGATVITTMAGTGSMIDFGPQSTPGTYNCNGTNATTGCVTNMGTATLTTLPSPGSIVGPSSVCVGSSVTLTDTAAGGTWSSSNPAVATVGSTGIVNGIVAGSTVISYTISSGCTATMTMNSINTVLPITGPGLACTGSTITLSDGTSSGTWSSTNPAVATIGSGTGVVTGVSTGTTTISYTISGCGASTATVSVHATPLGITGITGICEGAVSTLHDATTGGTWSSANTGIATVGSLSGVVVSVSTGTTTISYTVAGCSATTAMAIDPTPVISGPTNVCATSTIALHTTINGSWTSSNPTIASVVSGFMTGTVTGVYPGTVTLTCNSYSTGCVSTYSVSVTSTCTGTPAAGTTNAAAGTICSGNADQLYLTGYSTVCGTSYQWQYSSDSLAWGNISGANSDSLLAHPQASLYYRCKLTCFSTGLYSYSVPTHVIVYNQIASHTALNSPSAYCSGPDYQIHTCGIAPATNVLTYYGDGTHDSTHLYSLTPDSSSTADIFHVYNLPGTYTVKQILRDGTTRQDSVTFNYTYDFCRTLPIHFYFDANNNCADDDTAQLYLPIATEVDSNGIAIDTITAINGFYYGAKGGPGTIYRFKVLLSDTGLHMSCPTSGILYDTINSFMNTYPTKAFGFNCTASSAYDLSIAGHMDCSTVLAQGYINVNNTYCTPESTVVTMNFSPKYTFGSSSPAPYSVSGSTVTWHVAPLSVHTNSGNGQRINYSLYRTGAPLTAGDTVFSNYRITPAAGDVDTANNYAERVDTIRASYDPNRIDVRPAGNVIPCTPLQYTIHFQNTGNDTVHNIAVTDTLPDNADPRTLKAITASSKMHMAIVKYGTHMMVKFDFPNINLPDSTHHNQSEGYVVYSIKTKAGLSDGTVIANKAYIFFDDNTPVMTNTITNTIGISPITGLTHVCNGAQIQLNDGSANGAWSASNGNASVVKGLVTGLAAGVDTIKYTLTTSCATRTVTKAVTIDPNIAPSVSVVSATGTDTVCDGTSPVFTGAPVNGGSAPTYDWQVNGVPSGTGDTFSYAPPVSGDVVTVKLTSNAACVNPDTAVAGMALTVITPYIPPITLDAYPGIYIAPGTSDTFTATVTGGGPMPTFQWLLNGAPIPGATSDTFVSNTLVNGDSITCVATGTDFCKLSVFNSFIITVGNVGITHMGSNAQMVLFPNPNKGAFTIKGKTDNDNDMTMEVMNATGQMVYRKQVHVTNGLINEQVQPGNLSRGMYLLNLRTGSGNIVFRFVVE